MVFQIREAVSTATPKSRHVCPPSDMGRTSAPSPFFAEVAGAEDQIFNLFTVVLHGLADDYSITYFPNSSTSASLFNISSKYPSSTDSSSSSSKCSSYHQFLVPSAPSRCAQDNSTFKRPRMPSHLRLFRQIAVRRERGMIHPAYVPCRRASVVFPPRRQPSTKTPPCTAVSSLRCSSREHSWLCFRNGGQDAEKSFCQVCRDRRCSID